MNKLSIASFVLALTACIGLFAIKPATTAPDSHAETTYERVMRTGTIRCSYTYYSVGLFKDKDGHLQGIYKDLMDQISQLLDVKIEWTEEVGWGEQIEGLRTNRSDMVCSPANMTGTRAKAADFVTPFYFSPVYIWARKDDPRFGSNTKENLLQANSPDIKIATIDGEQSEAQAKQFFPKADLLSSPQSSPFSTIFTNVASGKADLTIAEPVAMHEFLDKNPDAQLVPIDPDNPLILAVNIMLVKNNDATFKSMISNAITILIANGAIDKILDKWEPYPQSYIRPSKTGG